MLGGCSDANGDSRRPISRVHVCVNAKNYTVSDPDGLPYIEGSLHPGCVRLRLRVAQGWHRLGVNVAGKWGFATALVLMSAGVASGASLPVVEGVQSPARVERGGAREPLAVDMSLSNKDTVVSGADARILLRMYEGSLVKLGADGQLALDGLVSKRAQQGGFFAASLDVLRGAFRFTTQTTSRFRGRREVDVRVATVTAGIRGTDLWGKAADDRDIVCLIEGKISVQRQGESQFTMDQPLSFYIAPRGEPALPVAPVPMEKLKEWAAETEIPVGGGAARRPLESLRGGRA